MNNKAYNQHTYDKISAVVKYYSEYIFEKIADITEISAYETADHLRTPPTRLQKHPAYPEALPVRSFL